MGKEFTYEKVISVRHDYDLDETVEGTEEFTYEADWKDVHNAIIDIVYGNNFRKMLATTHSEKNVIKSCIKEFIEDHDLYDILEENLEEELKEYFEEEAFKSLED